MDESKDPYLKYSYSLIIIGTIVLLTFFISAMSFVGFEHKANDTERQLLAIGVLLTISIYTLAVIFRLLSSKGFYGDLDDEDFDNTYDW